MYWEQRDGLVTLKLSFVLWFGKLRVWWKNFLQDTFRFSVTDGTFTTNRQNFEIDIKHTQKSMVHVVTNPAQVKEGDKVTLLIPVCPFVIMK